MVKVGFKVGCRWGQGSTKVVFQGGVTSGVKGGLRIEIGNRVKVVRPLGALPSPPCYPMP